MQRDVDLVFKGGTCLSKCYGIIWRFSEVCTQREPSERCLSAKAGMRLADLLDEIVDKGVCLHDYENVTVPFLYEDVLYESAVESLRRIAEFLDGKSRELPVGGV